MYMVAKVGFFAHGVALLLIFIPLVAGEVYMLLIFK